MSNCPNCGAPPSVTHGFVDCIVRLQEQLTKTKERETRAIVMWYNEKIETDALGAELNRVRQEVEQYKKMVDDQTQSNEPPKK